METVQVAIICSTAAEFRAVRKALPLTTEQTICGRTVAVANALPSFAVVHAMPGKVSCAAATQLSVDVFSPRLVLAAGAAGSLDDSVSIGSLVCAELCYEVDILPVAEFSKHAAELTSGTVAALGQHSSRPVLERFAAALAANPSPVQMRFGNIASGEANVTDAFRRNELRAAFSAIACDWETSAVVRIASVNLVDALSFRVITDLAGNEMAQEYARNREGCLETLATVIREFVCGGWVPRLERFADDESVGFQG